MRILQDNEIQKDSNIINGDILLFCEPLLRVVRRARFGQETESDGENPTSTLSREPVGPCEKLLIETHTLPF